MVRRNITGVKFVFRKFSAVTAFFFSEMFYDQRLGVSRNFSDSRLNPITFKLCVNKRQFENAFKTLDPISNDDH